ncbi:uncharacterized protein LOC127242390 [Andrographis paniculata]|uniref:uncharacterized protein LOC127242390 n=1 Tax=Andrographis paniculata TaxID=175694 RepID=UPI0021E7C342|nr:uncharacterized protein LOC127242390 [Andrographis paniculata]
MDYYDGFYTETRVIHSFVKLRICSYLESSATNIAKQEFVPLVIFGKNYLSWAMDVEMHLESMGLGETIARVKNPHDLWNKLKERYDHLKLIVLPKAHSEWHNLRLQDFKLVTEYNSVMFRITSHLNLCEQNNQLLLKNHASKPTSSSPFPEANAVQSANSGRGNNKGRRYGRGQKCNHPQPHRNNGKKPYKPLKWQNNEQKRNYKDKCHRCGTKGHWSHVYRTPKHLADLYQASLKGKNMSDDVNLSEQNNDDAYDDVLKNTSADVNLAE